MWVKQCHMTGNGKHTTQKNGDDQGMVYSYLPTLHLIHLIIYSPCPEVIIASWSGKQLLAKAEGPWRELSWRGLPWSLRSWRSGVTRKKMWNHGHHGYMMENYGKSWVNHGNCCSFPSYSWERYTKMTPGQFVQKRPEIQLSWSSLQVVSSQCSS